MRSHTEMDDYSTQTSSMRQTMPNIKMQRTLVQHQGSKTSSHGKQKLSLPRMGSPLHSNSKVATLNKKISKNMQGTSMPRINATQSQMDLGDQTGRSSQISMDKKGVQRYQSQDASTSQMPSISATKQATKQRTLRRTSTKNKQHEESYNNSAWYEKTVYNSTTNKSQRGLMNASNNYPSSKYNLVGSQLSSNSMTPEYFSSLNLQKMIGMDDTHEEWRTSGDSTRIPQRLPRTITKPVESINSSLKILSKFPQAEKDDPSMYNSEVAIKEMDQKFMQIQQNLNSLLASGTETIQLNQEEYHRLKQNQIIKIKCLGKRTPCTIRLTDFTIRQPSKYEVFVSQTEHQPDQDHCDAHYHVPKRMVISDLEKGREFRSPYIYIWVFFEDPNINLEISCVFPQTRSEKQITNATTDAMRKAIGQKNVASNSQLYERLIDEYQEWLAEMKKKKDETSAPKIQRLSTVYAVDIDAHETRHMNRGEVWHNRHKAFLANYPAVKQKNSLVGWEDKKNFCKEMKKRQYVERMNQMIVNNQRWEQVRLRKKAIFKQIQEIHLRVKNCNAAAKVIEIHKLLKFVAYQFYARKQFIEDKFRKIMSVQLIVMKMTARLKRQMPTQQLRNQLMISNSCTAIQPMIDFMCTRKAKQLFLKILRRTAVINAFFYQVWETDYLIRKNQVNYKKKAEILKMKATTLCTEIWMQQSAMLQKYFVNNKKKFSNVDKIVGRLVVPDKDIKDRVTQLYMARCNILHCVRFVQYLIKKRNPPDDDELYETLEVRLQQLHEVDVVLFAPETKPDLPINDAQEIAKTRSQIISDLYVATKENPNPKCPMTVSHDMESLERITELLYPLQQFHKKMVKMPVLDENFSYHIHVTEYCPAFICVPRSMEIIIRLILRAVFAENLDEFTIKLSVA